MRKIIFNIKNISYFLILFFLFPALYFANAKFDFEPELSYGVQDNSAAWIEMIPARIWASLTPTTIVKGEMSYQFEIPREYKPLSYVNHHGYRINAQVETYFTRDFWGFFEVNVGGLADGTMADIPYLRNFNYQRVGIKLHVFQ